MLGFVIIEIDEGLVPVDVPEDSTPEEVAAANEGRLVDPELFKSYEDAYEAMLKIPIEPEED